MIPSLGNGESMSALCSGMGVGVVLGEGNRDGGGEGNRDGGRGWEGGGLGQRGLEKMGS